MDENLQMFNSRGKKLACGGLVDLLDGAVNLPAVLCSVACVLSPAHCLPALCSQIKSSAALVWNILQLALHYQREEACG